MTNNLPHVPLCILIPCYNNLEGLQKSLKSIRYDAGKFLIVIVDDGSPTPFTKDDLQTAAQGELPIQLIRLPVNKGITVALNTGLYWIKEHVACEYVGRLDCGDICDPDRFYRQLAHLSVNPYIGLVGSWCWFKKPASDFKYSYKAPAQHARISREMYFRNCFIHPTVVFRFDLAERLGFYPDEFPHAEDYALFWEMVNHTETAILPSYLVVCELITSGISSLNRIKQLQSRLVIVRKFGTTFALKALGILKVRMLMAVPHTLIVSVKKLISF